MQQVIKDEGLMLKPLAETGVFFSLVIPTYNERENIVALLKQLMQILEPVYHQTYEIIVVDDDSPDRTWQIVADFARQHPQVSSIRRQHERGLSSAVIYGWQQARGDVLGVIDGDGQHPCATLLELLQAIKSHDMVIASRHVSGGGVSQWSWWRRFVSRFAQALAILIVPCIGRRVSDPMSGYFVVKRQAIANIPLKGLGYKILLECLGRGRINSIAEVGYLFNERTQGESKVSWSVYRDYLKQLCLLRRRI